jgi:hypothetical protein
MKKKQKSISAKAEMTPLEKTVHDLQLKDIRPALKTVDSLFQNWLKLNGKRFPYKIHPRRRRAAAESSWHTKAKEYSFDGLATELYFTLAPHTLQVHFDLMGEYYDGMCDFEIYPTQRRDGKYACAECARNWQERLLKTSKNRDGLESIKKEKYFASLAELYADHCFVPLLAWCKKTLKPRRMIIYCGEPEESLMAMIRPVEEVLSFTRPHRSLPLVLPKQRLGNGLFEL